MSETATTQNDGRVRPMSDASSSAVRAGQVIGSLSRAVEELVRNAVDHGLAKSVFVTVGGGSGPMDSTPFLEVSDDGIGMEPESLRRYVGTDHCSSSSSFSAVRATGGIAGGDDNGRGESLKALAALCVEMRVTSAASVDGSNERAGGRKKCGRNGGIITCEKVIRESVPVSFSSSDENEVGSTSSSVLPGAMRDVAPALGSRKRAKTNSGGRQSDPSSMSLRSILGKAASSTGTGTTVAINGLFYRYAVRRRHREREGRNGDTGASSSSSERAELAQVRACLRMLALAHPLVAFTLRSGRTGTSDSTWEAPALESFSSSSSSGTALPTPRFDPSLPMSSSFSTATSFSTSSRLLGSLPDASLVTSSLALRLRKHCGGDMSGLTTVPVVYEEEQAPSAALASHGNRSNPSSRSLSSRSVRTATSRREASWHVVGTLSFCARKEDLVDQNEESCTKPNRARQHEIVFINERPAHASALADIVQNEVLCYVPRNENSSYGYFVLHISCPKKHVDLVVDENRATLAVPNRDRIERLLRKAVSYTMTNNGFTRERKPSTKGDLVVRPSSRRERYEIEKSKATLRTASSRIISGERIRSAEPTCETNPSSPFFISSGKQSGGDAPNTPSPTCSTSPFTDAFLTIPSQVERESPAEVSFEDAFFSSDPPPPEATTNAPLPEATQLSLGGDADVSNNWTRTRVRALESQISNLAVKSGASASLPSRPMKLSKDMLKEAEVIAQVDAKFIVINAGGLVCVVDQHAADERVGLERLERSLSEETIEKATANASSSSLIKSVPLLPAQSIRLSSTQLATVTQHHNLLEKWRFTFTTPSDENEALLLSGVPGVCDKTATRQDFLQFLQALGSRTSDAALVKPAFVKRVLASHACRYAIMFGDVLSRERCVELLRSLSECDLCFICAHGRPSVIPLVDMNGLISKDNSKKATGESGFGRHMPLRFQTRHHLRRRSMLSRR